MNPRTLLFLGIAVLTSCTPVNRIVYRANPVNLPGLTEKGDSRITVDGGFNLKFDHTSTVSGADVQGAYAVSKRITLLGAYSGRKGDDQGFNDAYHYFGNNRYFSMDTAGIHYQNNTWELGAAYMIRFSRHAYLSLSGGGGGGDFHIDDWGAEHGTPYRCFLDAHQRALFVQPAMYFKSHWVEVGVGVKLSGTYYSRVHTNYPDSLQVDFVVNNLQGKTMYMVQPFWIFRVSPHLSWLQLDIQGSTNIGSNNGSSAVTYYFCYFNGSVGVSIYPTRLLNRLTHR
ncbi:hypothetical protein [Dinghuibacter silviterrae]|uniref:Uncharacterized protein n=1 Tax=Dinghuibacter silviterrae TaxID=1539049 RepID=A0A4R8DET1_9BACT|nr:hypothetical protein [Dinghuibacter silviterrae]TDW96069.1 hypothetical protein EDB95_3891 [Dinghuibacter silviterrae]